MTPEEMKKRTKKFALDAIKLSESLPHTRAGNIIANQLIRAATSVGANYRAACRARSKADFVSKISITLEESDESAYWTEIITESGMKLEQETFAFLKGQMSWLLSLSHHPTQLIVGPDRAGR